jgi:hypothetical protein
MIFTSSQAGADSLRVVTACVAAMFVLAASSCASDSEKVSAINAINQGFRADYEKLLAEKGSRVYPVGRADAFVAMRVALAQLGLRTEQQDMTLGHLAVAGSAPIPLSDEEWRTASQADLPLLRRLITPYVGVAANFVQFDPQGLDVVINATFLDTPSGTEVSLTVRLREVAPARSGWPRREYVSPHVLGVGLDKILGAFERELRAGPQR